MIVINKIVIYTDFMFSNVVALPICSYGTVVCQWTERLATKTEIPYRTFSSGLTTRSTKV
jgi:hypothetical protein